MAVYYKNKPELRSYKLLSLSQYDYSNKPTNYFIKNYDIPIWAIPLQPNKQEIIFGLFDGRLISFFIKNNSYEVLLSFKEKIYSSPILVGNSNLIISASDSGELACFDYLNKNIVWKVTLPASIHSSVNYFKEKLFIGCYDNHIYCIDVFKGKILNKRLLEDKIQENPYSSPIITSTSVLIGSGNYLYSLTHELDLLWRVNLENIVDSTPAVSELSSNGIIGTEAGDIFLFNLAKGDILNKINTNTRIVSSSAITKNNIACIGNDNGELYGFNLNNDTSVLWEKKFESKFNYTSITSIEDYFIFVLADGSINCINSIDGEVIWRIMENDKKYHTPPLVTNGYLFCGSHYGYIAGFKFREV